MSNSDSIIELGRRRKRVRKGTKSCWECKRRKIKCIYPSEDSPICGSCLDKGANCIGQEYEDDHVAQDEVSPMLSQRLEKVETLLEKLMERISNTTGENFTVHGSAGNVAQFPGPETTEEAQPLFNLSSSNSPEQHVEAATPRPPPQPAPVSTSSASSVTADLLHLSGSERLRRKLSAMLPCQEDIDHLWDMSHGWWLMRRHIMPHFLNAGGDDLQSSFNVSIVSVSHPMMIARLLLCVALCIQQLPPEVDPHVLQTKVPLREMIEQIIAIVTESVTSDDELVATTEGVECLLLQAVYHVNAGNLRKAWMVFRRAITVSQLMGLHRASLKTSKEMSDVAEAKRHHMWFQERYLSLILGLPSATASAPFPFDEHAPGLSAEDLYNKHLCQISGLLLGRNQGDTSDMFSVTQEIDQKLETVAQQMPSTWWEVPLQLLGGRTEEAASQFERLVCQIWHFELQTLVHLPFMLRAATERRYEYFRLSCMSASRGLIRTWMSIREAYDTTFVNNLIEFQAFTASITLILGLLRPQCNSLDPIASRERSEDLQLVETVVQFLEGLKRRGNGVQLVNQSISVIRTLQRVLLNEGDSPDNLRISIPHFGVIMILSGGRVQSLEGERILGANSLSNTTAMKMHLPLQTGSADPTQPAVSGRRTSTPITPSAMQNPSVCGNGSALSANEEPENQPVLHFTSSQFPTFDFAEMATDQDWSIEASDWTTFDGWINQNVGDSWGL